MSTSPADAGASPLLEPRPYHIVLVADLQSGGRLAGLTPVDKDNFGEILKLAKPALPMAVAGPTSGEWETRATFSTWKDFEPAGLVGQFDGGRWRLGVREKIVARQRGTVDATELKDALATAAAGDPSLAWLTQPSGAAGAGASPSAAGGSILDLVDEPGTTSRIESQVSELAAAGVDPSRNLPAAEAEHLRGILRRLDLELGKATEAALRHAEFRKLEAAWRSLKFLVDRIDFRSPVRLFVLDASREGLLDRLVEHVITPAFDGEIPTPGMLVLDYPMSAAAPDVALLDEIAQQAVSLPTPVAFPVDASFFNVKSLRLLKTLPNLSGVVDGWQFAKWRALREKPYSRVLAPVVGRFVLRELHDLRGEGAAFPFRETAATIGDVVWGGGHLAMAHCAARAYAANGWPTRMFGAEAGKLDNLPVVANPTDAQSAWGPGDLSLPDRRIEEFFAIGMNALISVQNADWCMLLGGVTAARAPKTGTGGEHQARLEVSLPYQQFASISSAFICELMPTLRNRPADEIQTRLLVHLCNLLRLGKEEQDAVMVGVGPSPDTPGQTVVQVRITPPPHIVPGGLMMDFGFVV